MIYLSVDLKSLVERNQFIVDILLTKDSIKTFNKGIRAEECLKAGIRLQVISEFHPVCSHYKKNMSSLLNDP